MYRQEILWWLYEGLKRVKFKIPHFQLAVLTRFPRQKKVYKESISRRIVNTIQQQHFIEESRRREVRLGCILWSMKRFLMQKQRNYLGRWLEFQDRLSTGYGHVRLHSTSTNCTLRAVGIMEEIQAFWYGLKTYKVALDAYRIIKSAGVKECHHRICSDIWGVPGCILPALPIPVAS